MSVRTRWVTAAVGIAVLAAVGWGIVRELRPRPPSGRLTNYTPGPAIELPLSANEREWAPDTKPTRLTGPLDKSGHLDVPEALNERLSKGISPETNANVAIWQILGPTTSLGEKPPPGYFEKLGMKEPPATGDYYIGLKQYVESTGADGKNVSFDTLARYTAAPWVPSDNAAIAGWLDANVKPLAALQEAVKRPHYYNPVIPEQSEKRSKGILTARLPSLLPCREAAAALACRAMRRLSQGRTEDAWQDLLTSHRLGRLIGRGGCLFEGFVGAAMEQVACRAEIAYLDRAALDARALELCLRDLAALPPIAPVADKLDLSERCMFLDIIVLIEKHGLASLRNLAPDQGGSLLGGLAEWFLDGTDWTPAIENANKWFDRLAACARERTRSGRAQELAAIHTDLVALKARATDFDGVAKRFREKSYSGKAKGEAVGDILISLMLPAFHKVIDAADRAQQTFDAMAVAYAVAWYKHTNGRYPDSLAELAPTYLKTVPGDLFSGKELIYRTEANGFLLYSVGVNGTDDGARWYGSQPPGDDIVVRIPERAEP